MKKELEFYKSYHNNTINKAIHFVCIPMIILSIMVFFKDFYILYEKNQEKDKKICKIPILDILIIFYNISYLNINLEIGIVMLFYFSLLKYLSIFLISNNYIWISKYLFIYGWVFQFIGHYIEGKRPALFDSLTQAFYQAPLFSLEYIFPSLFERL